ncbi:unnamed protein product [Coregonus sp. 'balchen']|nr:unnamed protein product [Coregonus sp. 'balchen']
MWSLGNFSEAEKVEQDVHVESITMDVTRRLPLPGSSNMTEMAYGFVANIIAVILYGSNFVPVKRIDTGDVGVLRIHMGSFDDRRLDTRLSQIPSVGNAGRSNLGHRYDGNFQAAL